MVCLGGGDAAPATAAAPCVARRPLCRSSWGAGCLALRQPALGLYASLSMGVMLLQGEVISVFRFGTVVFVSRVPWC